MGPLLQILLRLVKGFNVFCGTILLAISINSCDFRNERKVDNIQFIGELENGKEIGQWRINDKINKTEEGGIFIDGVRTGIWQYKFKDETNSINWQEFVYKQIRTNIPDFLSNVEVESHGSILNFTNSDSTSLLKVIIAVSNLKKTVDYEVYKKMTLNALVLKKIFLLDSVKSQARGESGKEYYYTSYDYKDSLGNLLVIHNIFGRDCRDEIIEVTVRASAIEKNLGWIIFNSITSNLFINRCRFLSVTDKVEDIK